jgi:hypothetical protein
MMLNDILKRVPLLALVPFVVWALGMTVYTVQWKTQIEYQLEQLSSSGSTDRQQAERISAIEQSIAYLREDVQDVKKFLLNNSEKTK